MDNFEYIKAHVENELDRVSKLLDDILLSGAPKAHYDVILSAKNTLEEIYFEMLKISKKAEIIDLNEMF